MKKYFLTSLMSLFLIAGTGLWLTANESKEKEKTSCCSSTTAEAVKTAAECGSKSAEAKSSCCSSKSASESDVQMTQTSSSVKSNCVGAASSCTGARSTQVSGPRPGECTKIPSGIRSQQANRND